MGMMDGAKDMLGGAKDQVDGAVDQGADMAKDAIDKQIS